VKRWGHGHSLVFGVAAGLLIASHPIIIGAVAFSLGVLAGRLWHLGWTAADLAGRWLVRKVDGPKTRVPRGRRRMVAHWLEADQPIGKKLRDVFGPGEEVPF
jgi:hypothetical protein